MDKQLSTTIATLDAMLVPLATLVDSLPPHPGLQTALADFRGDLDAARNVDPEDPLQVATVRAMLATSRTKLLSMLRTQ